MACSTPHRTDRLPDHAPAMALASAAEGPAAEPATLQIEVVSDIM